MIICAFWLAIIETSGPLKNLQQIFYAQNVADTEEAQSHHQRIGHGIQIQASHLVKLVAAEEWLTMSKKPSPNEINKEVARRTAIVLRSAAYALEELPPGEDIHLILADASLAILNAAASNSRRNDE